MLPFFFDPQTPGGGHPSALASSHKLGRAVALAVCWSQTVLAWHSSLGTGGAA